MRNDFEMAYLRVSRPKYNEDVYKNNKLYMNKQFYFHSEELTDGQSDKYEGKVSLLPMQSRWSIDEGKTWSKNSVDIVSLAYNPRAYIFSVYVVLFSQLKYDKESDTYKYTIPWDYIKKFWDDGQENEMLITPCTKFFKEKFDAAALKQGVSCTRGLVKYDLDERLYDPNYIKEVSEDGLTVVYHKQKIHQIENEYRFAVLCPEEPEHYELYLENTEQIHYCKTKLERGYSIDLFFENLKFDQNGQLLSFSKKIRLCHIKDGMT